MAPQTEASEAFRAELTALIPHMRAFAKSMCGVRAMPIRSADDPRVAAMDVVCCALGPALSEKANAPAMRPGR